ncbi:NAD-dependent succinate-semialdehyde dehydrogenase, partial [Pelagibacteraceae bacterium]|nr:NAD-dependent succinate-semialdehyde dehydrogenase [Pelagibacteraceae bacterium]
MELNNKSLFKEKCFVNGLWTDSLSGKTIEVNNPATMEIVGKVPNFTAEETKSAIDHADKAFQSWKNTTAKERSIILKKWSDLIIEHVDDLAKIMTIEQGKPLAEAKGEILMGASYIEFYAEEAKRVYGDIIPDPRPGKRIVIIKQPVGVVGAITPWNFPNSMITRKCAAALAVGCTTVVKPASQTPFSALAVAELAKAAGFPNGVFNIITGSAKEIGMELTKNPKIKKISFTGSTEVGKILMEQSASTVKKLSMELGGHAPFIVFEDANIDEAVTGAIQSKYRNSGQTCICTNRLFVHEKVYDSFLEKFTNEVKKIKVGNGLNDGIVSGPLIDKSSLDKVIDHVQDAVNTGAKIAVGGEVHSLGGNFYQPTVLSNVSTEAKITFEETFGPVAPLYKFSSDDEVIKMANDTPYGLASYFYSRDIGRIWKVAEALEYGIVSINNGLPTIPEIPFGGVKESGMGREGSRYGLDDYLIIKYISMGGI